MLEAYGVPVSLDRRPPLARTRLGAGVLAGARAALPGGTAADLLTWLRTPGRLADPDAADALETLTCGAPRSATAAEARAAARRTPRRSTRWPTRPRPGRRRSSTRSPPRRDAIWTAPHRRAAAVLGARGRRRRARRRRAARRRRRAARARGRRPGAGRLARRSCSTRSARVPVREPAVEGAVLVADPLAIRARRFRAVFVCGLQEGVFPRHPVPEPFLDDAARISLARASGHRARRATRTSSRASATCSTRRSRGPRRCCSSRSASSDEEGEPVQPSAFVDDVRALFTDELWERRGRRLLAEVTWPPGAAPTPHELRRARAAEEELPEPPPLGAPRHRAGARPASPRARPRPRAGWRRSPAAACAG